MGDSTYLKSEDDSNIEVIDAYLTQINKEKFQGLLPIKRMQNESWEIFLGEHVWIDVSFGEKEIKFSRSSDDCAIYIEIVLRTTLEVLLNGSFYTESHNNSWEPDLKYLSCKNYYDFKKLCCAAHRLNQRMIEDFEYFPVQIRPLFGISEKEMLALEILSV